MARLRVLNDAYMYIVSEDPETDLTKHGLRRYVLEGKIPSLQNGKKRLINLDDIDNFLSTPTFIAKNDEI